MFGERIKQKKIIRRKRGFIFCSPPDTIVCGRAHGVNSKAKEK